MRTIKFFMGKTPPSTALRDLAHKLVAFVLISIFAVELAIQPQFLMTRKVWPQSSFEKERVGQK